MTKNLLLVCYDFPPNKGIGGRRWAKLAKQLAANGHTVYVIKANPEDSEISAWVEDVKSANIHLHSLNSHYPKYINEVQNTLLAKIIRRVKILSLENKEKGTIYDKSFKWEKELLSKSRALIEAHNIRNIIATGAPFNIGYYLSKLKKENNSLNFIFDYRDPWISTKNYGMNDLSVDKMNYEKYKQNQLIEYADHILSPSIFMLEEIRETSKCNDSKYDHKFMVLPHFYDVEDLPHYQNKTLEDKDKIRFVYGGTLYHGTEKYLKNINDFLSSLKQTNIDLYNKIEFQFYTDSLNMEALFTEHLNACKFYKPIGKEIFNKIQDSNFILIFLGDHNKNYKTTKFFEFLTFRKPYIYFGPEGDVCNEIETKNLGCNGSNLLEYLEDYLKGAPNNFNANYPVENNNLEVVTKSLEQLFI